MPVLGIITLFACGGGQPHNESADSGEFAEAALPAVFQW